MSLKEKLGEELFEQVNEKLGENEKLILNDGSYIPKSKFDEANEKAKELENEIEERDNQIEQLKNDTQATDELKQKIEDLQEKNEQTKEELTNKLVNTKKDAALDRLFNDAKYPELLKKQVDYDSLDYDEENDEIKNVDGLKEQYKESYPDLFGETQPSKGGEDFKKGNKGLTMAQVDEMTDKEINDNWEEVAKVLEGQKK